MRQLQLSVRQDQRDLDWRARRALRVRAALVAAAVCVPGLVAWRTVYSDQHRWLVAGSAVLGAALGFSTLFLVVMSYHHLWKMDKLGDFAPTVITVEDRYKLSTAELRDRLELSRAALRRRSALAQAPLQERRVLYREDVAEVIDQFQKESLKYRRVHNSLQSLIMAGSTTVTTVAAMDTKDWTWQTILVIVIGFCVALASTFTGYFKYRERSYFLQQTADAIEEESNAFALGVGEYGVFGVGEEDRALARFTERVEALRNEQRRRQQQLDQPTEQTPQQGSSNA
ncbi:DUF4231 domain-containing protein [Streptomyces sp. NPDC088763]|uniref:DUF4231 domain-containing protein n=1 Tax=Streptomyces sp. NPDC088763 TaxID=3365892 RepID=UPI00381D2AF2